MSKPDPGEAAPEGGLEAEGVNAPPEAKFSSEEKEEGKPEGDEKPFPEEGKGADHPEDDSLPPSGDEEEVSTVERGVAEEPLREATHGRRHCPSFRLLLRRQLWVNTVRVAATLRRFFRTRRATQGSKRRKETKEVTNTTEETPPEAASPSRRLFPALIEGSSGKVGPSEAVAISPRGGHRELASPPSSAASSPAKTFGTLFRRNSPSLPTPPSPQAEPNMRHMRLVRSRRLLKEFRELTKAQMGMREPVFTVDLVNDCLYEWKVSGRVWVPWVFDVGGALCVWAFFSI